MLRHILLLTPVYVTFFWSIMLNADRRVSSVPRLFLGKFMFFAFIVYLSHLIYFVPNVGLYAYIDPLYQLASLIVFPMYHIYFRLLTVDSKFQLRKHAYFLLPSIILFLLYTVGVFITPFHEYSVWIFNRQMPSVYPGIKYLKIIEFLTRIVFIIQVLVTIIGNYRLIKKYGHKANQFYSDMDDIGTKNVTILNASMIVSGVSSIILASLGRNFFENKNTGIALASIIFSSMLFIIGWLGNKQKSLNPVIKLEANEEPEFSPEIVEFTNIEQKNLLEKIQQLFYTKKIYLNSKLTIQDVAQEVGTNRTYISTIINQQFNQNFCNFVNGFRVEEMEKIIIKHPYFNNQLLAESCGFGSVDSLKRAVLAKTGQKLSDWKKQFLQEVRNDPKKRA